jgi:membrane-associated phospholipid phosphatase
VAKNVKYPLAACLACAGALVVLVTLAYKFGPVERLDASILTRAGLAPFTPRWETANGFARLADPLPLLVMLLAICGLALAAGRRREALAAVAVVAGANLTTQILKGVLAHPRFEYFIGFHAPWPNAFPSGHATAAASISVALLLAAPARLRLLAIALGLGFTAAVSVAVIALQWHYPSDVLGGILIASGWGFAALAALGFSRRRERAPEVQTSSRFAISMK